MGHANGAYASLNSSLSSWDMQKWVTSLNSSKSSYVSTFSNIHMLFSLARRINQYVNCNKRISGEISLWVVQTARARIPRVSLTHPSHRGSCKSGSLAITHLRRAIPCSLNSPSLQLRVT